MLVLGKLPSVNLDNCFIFVEILLFSESPSGKYEYCDIGNYTDNENAIGHSDDDSDDGYENILPALPASSQPAASSKLFSAQPTKPVVPGPSVPARKTCLFEHDGRRNAETTEEYENVKPRPYRLEKKTKEPNNKSLPVTCAKPADSLIYEVLDQLPNLTVKAKDEATKRKQDGDKHTETSRPQRQTSDQQYEYATPRVRTAPKKQQPPPTKPKTFKRDKIDASPSSEAVSSSLTTGTCRVKPFVTSKVPLPSQSSASPGHWKSARDVPAQLDRLSVEEVTRCMELLHLPKLAAAFKSQDVDGRLLVSIVNEEVLVSDFHCRRFEAKKVIEFVKNGWRPNE